MTRLFLRFYLGVLVILFAAWLIQTYVFRRTAVENNVGVVETALAGGARLARDEILQSGADNYAVTLARIQTRFDFPCQLVPRDDEDLPPEVRLRLQAGEVVLHRSAIKIALPQTPWLLSLGPLPQFSTPTQAEITAGLGSVFVLAALAIAILLRPLAFQLRSVERTALAIAGGDFSARIGNRRGRQALPFAGAFNSMADRVEQLLRSQRELMQAVSHELRTPLARIQFATELLRTTEDATHRCKRIDAIDQATDQLEGLVDELLTYVRLDAETENNIAEPIEIETLLSEAVGFHAPLYPAKQFEVQVSPAALRLESYRPSLLRAVGNLLSNAGKYSGSRVLVSAQQQGTGLLISVDDDGPGIAATDRQLVFEPFKRLSHDGLPGTGLGLALVRRICRRLGGEVHLTESPLGGARFSLWIPATRSSVST